MSQKGARPSIESHDPTTRMGQGEKKKIQFDLDKTKEKLREILEDSEDEYEVPFTYPSELLDIFSTLEEQNLFLI
jgi:hypothetical protein